MPNLNREMLRQMIAEEIAKEGLFDEPEIDISHEDRDRFQDAYTLVGQAVDAGTLPESVEDAFHDMLHLLGIYV